MGGEVLILLSGGIDSTALIKFYLNRGFRVSCLHIQYNQPSSITELSCVRKIASKYDVDLSIVNTGFPISSINGEFFCRNALFLMIAAANIPKNCKIIALGIHGGSAYYDCSENFVLDMQTILDGYFGGTVLIETPFLKFGKSEIFDFCFENSVPIDLTYSCEKNELTPCGICGSCIDRRRLNNEQY